VEEEQDQQTHRKSKEEGSQPIRKKEGVGRRTTLESDSDTGAGMKAVCATLPQSAKKLSCIATYALILETDHLSRHVHSYICIDLCPYSNLRCGFCEGRGLPTEHAQHFTLYAQHFTL